MPTATAPIAMNMVASAPPLATSPPARRAPHAESTPHVFDVRQFAAMEAAYRPSGGIASGDDVALLLRQSWGQPISRLARWIVARDVVSFQYGGTTWLPLFQFERAPMCVRPDVKAVIREISDVFDDWELAAWFALPNAWLQGSTPVDALLVHPSAVREAARADRFIAHG